MSHREYSQVEASSVQPGKRTIADYCEGRDNNFNLLRVLAATLVILTHAYGLSGNEKAEPWKAMFDLSFGSWAVNIFFVSSGFLIAKSWDRGRWWPKFLWARFVRIYPALWVCVLLCVFGVGLIFTTLSVTEFLQHPETLKFLAKNMTLLKGTFTSLPGVFTAQGEGDVNVSLWTLPYEIKMYFALLALGLVGWLYKRWLLLAIILLASAGYFWSIANAMQYPLFAEYTRFIFFFFCGSYFYLMRDRIPLDWKIALSFVIFASATLMLSEIRLRTAALSLATPYLVIYLAYVPGGAIRAYNKLGDYSYGLYIYGAPVQHVLYAVIGGALSVTAYFLIAFAITLTFAVISWHALESRALQAPLPKYFTRFSRPDQAH